jgi:hypothetical protein
LVQLAVGRFALGLNFGTGAFNGDQRWVQVEFRSPAGVGQYLALNPRDKIMATPYALYALNGTASQWNYNPKTQALTAAANVSKVGIGTTTPTAALEVVSAAGGDNAVKLPAGSIGEAELVPGLLGSASAAWSGAAYLGNSQGAPHAGGQLVPIDRTIALSSDGVLTVSVSSTPADATFGTRYRELWIDGVVVATIDSALPLNISVALSSGVHNIQVRSQQFPPCAGNCVPYSIIATCTALFTPSGL